MNSPKRIPVALLAGLIVAFCLLYARVAVDLARAWVTDENYSHGPLIALAIVYFVWARRDRLRARPIAPSNAGLVVVAASLAILMVGTAGVEFFMMRVSAVGVVAGGVLFVAGWGWLAELAFPLGLTALVIPIPPVLFYQAAFPLQLLATRFGVFALRLFDIPVLREGNVIALAHMNLEVTEACSGIRSLVSLFSLAVIYGYFTCGGAPGRIAVALSSVPIAILANGARIAGTGIAAEFIGASAASGFFHMFSGWAVFIVSALMLFGTARLVAALGRLSLSQARLQSSLS
jgi:exosortase